MFIKNIKVFTLREQTERIDININERAFFFHIDTVDHARELFNYFCEIFESTKNTSEEIIELTIGLSTDEFLGFKTKEIVVQKNMEKPNLVVVQARNGDETQMTVSLFRKRLESSGLFDKNFTLINPKMIKQMGQWNQMEIWKFLREKVLLVDTLDTLYDELCETNRKDYLASLNLQEKKEDVMEKMDELQSRINVATKARDIHKEIQSLKVLIHHYHKIELKEEMDMTLEFINLTHESITKIDEKIHQTAFKKHSQEALNEGIEEITEVLDCASYDLNCQILLANECLEVLPIDNFRDLDTSIDTAWESFSLALNETQNSQKLMQKLHQNLQDTKSKITFLNLFQSDWNEANLYLKNLKKTILLQEKNLKKLNDEENRLKMNLEREQEETKASALGCHNSFLKWESKVEKSKQNFSNFAQIFENALQKLVNSYQNFADLQLKLCNEEAIVGSMKMTFDFGEDVEGLIELEVFLNFGENADALDEIWYAPLYKLLNLKDEIDPLEPDFMSILPIILVKTQDDAELILSILPQKHEYTFLILDNCFSQGAPVVLKRSLYRNLKKANQFLLPNVQKSVIKVVDLLLQNTAVVNEENFPLQELVKLRNDTHLTLINNECDKVTGSGTISGGYKNVKQHVKKFKDYIEMKVKTIETKKKLLNTKLDLEKIKDELASVRTELYFIVNDDVMYGLSNIKMHHKWTELLALKEHHVKCQNLRELSKIRLESTKKLVQSFEKITSDQENLAESESIEQLYEKKKQVLQEIKEANTKWTENRNFEMQQYNKMSKILQDLREIELKFEISSEIPLSQCHEGFNEHITKGINKLNDLIHKAIDTLLELCLDYQEKEQNSLENTDLDDKIMGYETQRLHYQNEVGIAFKQLRELESQREMLVKDTMKANMRLNSSLQQQYPTIESAIDRHNQLIQTLYDDGIPCPINFQQIHNDKVALRKLEQFKLTDEIIFSPFLDNLALLFPKMYFRLLRKIFAYFDAAMKKLNLSARIQIILNNEKYLDEGISVESFEGIKFNAEKKFIPLCNIIFLISISLALEKPFVLLYDFLHLIPESSQIDVCDYLQSISTHIQVLCIDYDYLNLLPDQISEIEHE